MEKILLTLIFLLPLLLFACADSKIRQLEISDQRNQELIQEAEAEATKDLKDQINDSVYSVGNYKARVDKKEISEERAYASDINKAMSKFNSTESSISKPIDNTPIFSLSTPSPPKLINKSGGIFHGLEYEEGTVARVIDGDTIDLEDGRRIRYLGVDTRERGECYYNEAKKVNENFVKVNGLKIRMYKGFVDPYIKNADQDRYGRYLRYITTPTGASISPIPNYSTIQLFVNDDLIRMGYGINRTDYKDQQLPHIYQIFVNSENQAKANLEGLWGACR